MSYLDEVILPTKTSSAIKPAATSKNSYLDDVVVPTSTQSASTQQTNKVSQMVADSRATSDKANSIFGLLKSTFSPSNLFQASGIPEQFNAGQQEIDQAFIDKGQQDAQPGGATLGQRNLRALQGAEGIGTKLTSPLAPILKPLSQFVDLVGSGKEPYSDTKKVPSISDIPAVQKFSNTPTGIATAKNAGTVSTVANVAGMVLGGIEGVKGFAEKPPAIEAPNGGTGTGTYPPATVRAETPVKSTPITTDTKLTNPAIGKIEVIQGRPTVNGASGFGLAKIVGDHPDVLPHIEEGLKNAQVTQELPQRTILESPKTATAPPMRFIVDHQLGTEPKTFLNNAYVLREGFEPPTSPASGERSTTELSKQTVNTPTVPNLPEKSMNTTQETTPVKTGRTTQTLKPVEGTGDIKTRGLSQGVEANAIEKKLTDTFGDLPEYKQVNMKEQAAKAADFITHFPDAAKEVALGNKAPPKGLLPESVFVAAERKALAEGDVDTLRGLANSKLSASATTMGQRIRTLGERDENSLIQAIQDIQKVREEAQARRNGPTKKATKATVDGIKVDGIKKEIQKIAPKKQSWNEFIDEITC